MLFRKIRKVDRQPLGREGFVFYRGGRNRSADDRPHVKDKFTDSPVLVMDEKGSYVIPLLSGHVGGAVELAKEIAEKINAQAVLTTATDVEQKFAVDVFAKAMVWY